MGKFTTLCLVLVLALFMSGCGNQTENELGNQETQSIIINDTAMQDETENLTMAEETNTDEQKQTEDTEDTE